MNRTRRSKELAPSVPVPPQFQVDAGRMETAAGDTVHSLFAPLHYEPGYAYPLLVWLHGLHGDERHILRIMPLVSMQNYVAVAPRGLEAAAVEEGRSGFGWRQTDDHIQQAEQRVFDGIETASKKLHVSPQRVFLAGFDCGGSMALRLAMSHPDRFAGVSHCAVHCRWAANCWPTWRRSAACRCSWPWAVTARSIRKTRSATICGCCTRPGSR